jgi:hypothetical protein
MKKAIAFLTRYPQLETLAFAEQLAFETDFDIFIFSDEIFAEKEEYVIRENFKVISYTDNLCKETGYVNSMIGEGVTMLKKNPITWDKMIYHFCEKGLQYDFVWVFEDDVFIPKVETILNLDKKYSTFDLVTPNNFLKKDNLPDWHWKHIFDKIEPPYYYSMVCACGMSRKMLDAIKEYVKNSNQLFFIEAMFNTLAMQNNLEVTDAFEFKSVVWLGEWFIDEFLLLPNNVFHPKKNIEDYQYMRLMISHQSKNGYKPVNKLPDFIKDLL